MKEELDRYRPTLRLFRPARLCKEGFMARMGSRLASLAAVIVAVVACGGSSSSGSTDVGVTSSQILLGNTIAQSGPAAAYGTIANAENAYFTYVNNNGGVNGRKVTFTVLDDCYNPAKTVPLTHQLIELNKVFAMFCGLGN